MTAGKTALVAIGAIALVCVLGVAALIVLGALVSTTGTSHPRTAPTIQQLETAISRRLPNGDGVTVELTRIRLLPAASRSGDEDAFAAAVAIACDEVGKWTRAGGSVSDITAIEYTPRSAHQQGWSFSAPGTACPELLSTESSWARFVMSRSAPLPGGVPAKRVTPVETAERTTGTPPAAPVDTTSATIREKCAREWPDDFAVRAYCEKQQREAVAALAARSMTSSDERTIRTKCEREWPDDFAVRDYCEKQNWKRWPPCADTAD